MEFSEATGSTPTYARTRRARPRWRRSRKAGGRLVMKIFAIDSRGTVRLTICVGAWAAKIARNAAGRRCNLFEADLWARTTEARRNMLCPVLACLPFGVGLIMHRAEPLSEDEADRLRTEDGFPDWDYMPPDDEGHPFEYKASDWGRLPDGRLVALDYSTAALSKPATDLEEAPDRKPKPEVVPITCGTGTWPMVRPRPWKLTPDRPGEAVLIDPVAVASETAFRPEGDRLARHLAD